MEDKNIMKNSFDKLNPTEEQRVRLWEQISQEQPSKKNRWYMKATAAAAVFILCVAGVNLASGGRVMAAFEVAAKEGVVAAIAELCGLDKDSKEIVQQAVGIQKNGIEVYAPEIYYLDKEMLLFGGLRGLMIYDFHQEAITATIDLQEIGCIYFNSDTKETHVLKQGECIYVYNSENEKPMGEYYEFTPKDAQTLKLTAVAKNDEQALAQLHAAWQTQRKKVKDTFDSMQDAYFLADGGKYGEMYSQNAYSWKDEQNQEFLSCLIVKGEGEYYLYSANGDEVPLHLEKVVAVTRQEAANDGNASDLNEPVEEMLPEFVYSGEDEVVAAICEYLVKEEKNGYYIPDADWVAIPQMQILGREEAEGELLVFGTFAISVYTRNGEILECASGGNMHGCVHLRKEDNVYQVTEVQWALDGGLFDDSLQEITANYPQYYEGLMSGYGEGEREQLLLEMLRMYVKDNNLSIKYYKDYGWDPVAIE
ncbi:MAG: DUF4179 domain-containing protein [Lachnospiraceae bacterium]|nr:DUF4179 domain-containing protein [Lachnospiraceae bacterium]